MSTYNNIYSVSNYKRSERVNTAIISTDAIFTLYEAREKLRELFNVGQTNDATVIRCNGRCVGFFSKWHGDVTPMFGAHEDETYLLTAWMEDKARAKFDLGYTNSAK